MSRFLRRALLGVFVLLVLMQIVPYGHDHSNPPGRVEPTWDRPETRDLARRACFDCHSNETVWPWYSHVAPVSWLVQHDVDEGRGSLNLSQWDRPQKHADHAAKLVREGKMPLSSYLPMHPSARLSSQEKEALATGLAATIGEESGEEGGEPGENDND